MAESGSKLFICGQHTVVAWDNCKEWFRKESLRGPTDETTAVSAPPFNLPELPPGSETFPKSFKQLNVPCYGGIPDEVMKLFDNSKFKKLAESMKIKIPEYKIDTFLKGKMGDVRSMVEFARTLEGYNETNAKAADKLKAFADDFEQITDSNFNNISDWKRFMDEHAAAGWEDKLSFDDVLSNFGFEDAFASALRQSTTEVKDDKLGTTQTIEWQHQGLRWVSKAMTGYKPAGCLTDVVNLVFAMEEYTPEKIKEGLSEAQIKDVLGKFGSDLSAGRRPPWVPSHMLVDCESDDMLAWCLVASIEQPKVLAQLPQESEANAIAAYLTTHLKCEVFRDPGSRNMKALSPYWSFVPEAPDPPVSLKDLEGTLKQIEVRIEVMEKQFGLASPRGADAHKDDAVDEDKKLMREASSTFAVYQRANSRRNVAEGKNLKEPLLPKLAGVVVTKSGVVKALAEPMQDDRSLDEKCRDWLQDKWTSIPSCKDWRSFKLGAQKTLKVTTGHMKKVMSNIREGKFVPSHRKALENPDKSTLPRDPLLKKGYDLTVELLRGFGDPEALKVIETLTLEKHGWMFHWAQSMVAGPVILAAWHANTFLWSFFICIPFVAIFFDLCTCDAEGGMAHYPTWFFVFCMLASLFPFYWEICALKVMLPAQLFIRQVSRLKEQVEVPKDWPKKGCSLTDDQREAIEAVRLEDTHPLKWFETALSKRCGLKRRFPVWANYPFFACYIGFSFVARLDIVTNSLLLAKAVKTHYCSGNRVDRALHLVLSSAWGPWEDFQTTPLYKFVVIAWGCMLFQLINATVNSVPVFDPETEKFWKENPEKPGSGFHFKMNNREDTESGYRYFIQWRSLTNLVNHHEDAAFALTNCARMRTFTFISPAECMKPDLNPNNALKAGHYYNTCMAILVKFVLYTLLETVIFMQIQTTSATLSRCGDSLNGFDYQLIGSIVLSILSTMLTYAQTIFSFKTTWECLEKAAVKDSPADLKLDPSGETTPTTDYNRSCRGSRHMIKCWGILWATVFPFFMIWAIMKLYMNSSGGCECGWNMDWPLEKGCVNATAINGSSVLNQNGR